MKAARPYNSLLIQLFIWTTAITLVSVLLVSSIAYINLNTQIQENADNYYQKRFTYACEIAEQQVIAPVVAMQQEFLTLSSIEEELRPLSIPLETQNSITNIWEMLASMIKLYPQIADISVYSMENSFLVSGISGVKFYNDSGTQIPCDDAWLNMLAEIGPQRRSIWLPSRPLPQNMGIHGDVFSLVSYINYTGKAENTLYLCLSLYCDALLSCVQTHPDESFFLVDAAGQAVAGSGSLPAQTQYDTGTFMDRDFVYLIADSSCNGWRYVLRVPQAQYSAYGQALTSQIVRVSIAVFLVMALVSLLVIGRLTAPFSNLLARAQNLRQNDSPRKKHSGMHFVADVFDEYVTRTEAEQNQLESRLALLKRSFLLSLLHGKQMNKSEMDSYMDFLKLHMPHGYFSAMVILNPMGPFTPEMEAQVEALFATIPQSGAAYFFAGAYGRRVYILVNHTADWNCASIFHSSMNRANVPVWMRVALGDPVRDFARMNLSLQQAERALLYFSYYPERDFLLYAETRLLDEHPMPSSLPADKFYACLSAERFQEAAFYLKIICASILENGVAYAVTDAWLNEATTKIAKFCDDGLYDDVAKEFWLSERFSCLARMLESLEEHALSEKPDYAEKAAQYIQENYMQDLSVPDIADALNVSRSYLSRLFKEAHGITIVEYILNVRLSHAVRLLFETDLSATEIASKTGFNNSNYFFKKFKEKYGVTPMQYRNEQL